MSDSSRYSAAQQQQRQQHTPSPQRVFFAVTPPPPPSRQHPRRPGSVSSGGSSATDSPSPSPSNLAFNARAAAMAASTAPFYAAAALRSPQAIAASQYPTSIAAAAAAAPARPHSSIGRRHTQSPVGWVSPPPLSRPRSSLAGGGDGGLLQSQHQRHWSTPPPSQQQQQQSQQHQQHFAFPRTSPRSAAPSAIAAPVALSRAQLLAQWSAEKAARSAFLNGSLYPSAAPPALPYSPSSAASTASNSQASSTASLMQAHQWSSSGSMHHPQPHPPLSSRSASASPGHSNGNSGLAMAARPPSSSRPHTPASALKGGRALHAHAHLRASSAVSTAFSDGSSSLMLLDDLAPQSDQQQQDQEQVFVIRPMQHAKAPPRPSAASPFGSHFGAEDIAAAADDRRASPPPSLPQFANSPDRITSAAAVAPSNGDQHAAVSAHVARARMLREQRAALADQDALVPALPLLLGGTSAPPAAATSAFARSAAAPPPGPHDPLPLEPHLTPAPSASSSSHSPSHAAHKADASSPPPPPRLQVAEDHFWCSWTASRCCDARALSLDAQLIALANCCASERGASLLSASHASPASLLLAHTPRSGSSTSGSNGSSMLDLSSAELASLLLIAPLPLLLCLLDCYIAARRCFLSFSALERALSASVAAQLARWRSTTMTRESIHVPPASDPAWQAYLASVVRPFVQSMEDAARHAAAQRRQREAEEERRAQYVFGAPPDPKPEETEVARNGRVHASEQEEKEEAEAQVEAAAKTLPGPSEPAASQPLSPAHLQRLESLEDEIRQLRAQLQLQSKSTVAPAASGTTLHAPVQHSRQTADSSSQPASSSTSRRASATAATASSASSATAPSDPEASAASSRSRSRSRRASQEPEPEQHVIPKARSARRASGPGATIGTTILPDTEPDSTESQPPRSNGPAAATSGSQSSSVESAPAPSSADPVATAAPSAAPSSAPAPVSDDPDPASGSADNLGGTILSFMQPQPRKGHGHAHSPSIVPEESDSDMAVGSTPNPEPAAATSPRFAPKTLDLREAPEEGEATAKEAETERSTPSSGSLALQQLLTHWAVSDQASGSGGGTGSNSRPGSGPLPYKPARPLSSASSFTSSSSEPAAAPPQRRSFERSSSDERAAAGAASSAISPAAAPAHDLSHSSPHSLRAMAARNAALRHSSGGSSDAGSSAANSNRAPGRVMSIDTKYDRTSRSASPPGSPFSSPSAAAAGILLSPALPVRRAGTPQTPPDIPGGTRSRSGSLSGIGGGGGGAGGGERATTPSRAMTPRPRVPTAAVVVGPVPVQRISSASVPSTPGASSGASAGPGHSRFASRGGSLTPLPLSSLVSSGVLPSATATEQQELLEAVLHDYPAPETVTVVAAAARSRANSFSKRSAGEGGIDSFHRRHAAGSSASNSNSTAILPLDELNEQHLPLFASTVREESTSTSSSASVSTGSNPDQHNANTAAAPTVVVTTGAGTDATGQSEAPVVASTAPSAVDSILSAAAETSPPAAAAAAAAVPVAVPNLRHPVVSMEQVASFLLWASPSLFFSPSRMRTTLTTNDVEYLVQIAHTELSALQHLQALQKLSKQYEDFHALLLAVHELQTFRVHRRDYVVASLSYPRCTLFSRSACAVTVDAQDIDWLVDACNGEVEWIDYICCMLDTHAWRVSDDPGVRSGAPGALGGFGKLIKVVYKLYSAVADEQRKLKKFLTFDPEASGSTSASSSSADSRRSSATSDGGAPEISYPVPLRLLRDSNNLPRTMDSSEVDDLCHRLKPLQHVSGLWAFMRKEQAKAVAEYNLQQQQMQAQAGSASAPDAAAAVPPVLHKAASGFRVNSEQAAATVSMSGATAAPAAAAAPLFPPLESALPPLLLLQSFALDRLSFRTPLTLFQALWECGDFPPVPPFIHRAVGLEPALPTASTTDGNETAKDAAEDASATNGAVAAEEGEAAHPAASDSAASSQQLSQAASIAFASSSAAAADSLSAEDQSQCRTVRAKLRAMARRKELHEAAEAARIVAQEAAAAAAEAAAAAAATGSALFVPDLPSTHAHANDAVPADAMVAPSAAATAAALNDVAA